MFGMLGFEMFGVWGLVCRLECVLNVLVSGSDGSEVLESGFWCSVFCLDGVRLRLCA